MHAQRRPVTTRRCRATILPYVAVSAVALPADRRLLGVLRVGEDEAGSLEMHVGAGSAGRGRRGHARHGGGVGQLTHRGAAFLVLADIVARTIEAAQRARTPPTGTLTAKATITTR